MREVQCSECLQFVPFGYALHGYLTVYEKNSTTVKHGQKMYACCADHYLKLVEYYRNRNDCMFLRVTA